MQRNVTTAITRAATPLPGRRHVLRHAGVGTRSGCGANGPPAPLADQQASYPPAAK